MIRFSEDYSLKPNNTFNIDARAKFAFEFTDPEDLQEFIASNKSWNEEKILVAGQGSNLLFIGDFDGLVIFPNIPGIRIVKEDRQNVWIEAGAGEYWDDFVQFAVENDFGGIENMSFIPGKIGASPVQNIGAYGQEVANVIEKVIGIDTVKNRLTEIDKLDCEFGYRTSIFKTMLKNRFIITSAVFKLEKFPEFVLGYGDVEKQVKTRGEISLENIRSAIIEFRQSKLPDFKVLGNAGSFFKNPQIESEKARLLKVKFPELPVYSSEYGTTKLAAGWLIENAGWKGFREGDAGVHEKQALVLVNYGNASGRDIFKLSEKIKESVFRQFGIELEREVNCITPSGPAPREE